MTTVAEAGRYRVWRNRAKESAWWTDEMKRAAERKKAYKIMSQKNVAEEIIQRRRNEYKAWKKKVK